MRNLFIAGNACLDCHRVGMETVRLLNDGLGYPNNMMPPSAPGTMSDDYSALVDCWYNSPEDTPGCEWIVPPATGCDAQVVGAEYPNVSKTYNMGGDLDEPPSDGQQRSAQQAAHGPLLTGQHRVAGAALGCGQ